MKLAAFAFTGTNSENVLKKLSSKTITHKDLLTDEESIRCYIDKLSALCERNIFILGLGLYSKKSDSIRIETNCSNKFRRTIFGDSYCKYKIKPWLLPTNGFVYANGIGISYCNLVSYLITTSSNIEAEYSFLHLPKNLDCNKMSDTIDQTIRNQIG